MRFCWRNWVFKWAPFSASFFPVLCCVSTLILIQLSWDSNRFLIRKNWFFASEGIHWWSYTKGDQWKIRSRELIILKVIYRLITCTLQWRHKRINNPRAVFYQVHPKAIQEGNIRVMSKYNGKKENIVFENKNETKSETKSEGNVQECWCAIYSLNLER